MLAGSEGFTGIGLTKGFRGGSVRCSILFRDLCEIFGSCPIVDVGLVETLPSSLSAAVEIGRSMLSAAELRDAALSRSLEVRPRRLIIGDGAETGFDDGGSLPTCEFEIVATPIALSLCALCGEVRGPGIACACSDVRRGLMFGPGDNANAFRPGGVRWVSGSVNDSFLSDGGEEDPRDVGLVAASVSEVREVLVEMNECLELSRSCSSLT